MSSQLQPTVWERLVAGDAARQPRARFGIADLRESIRAELTRLLNTISYCQEVPEELAELKQSLVNFGLEDYTGVNIKNSQTREQLRRSLEQDIRRFEPRLTAVRVTIVDDGEHSDRTLRFRIDAHTEIAEQVESMSFESRFDVQRRRFQVQAAGR